MDYTKLLVCFLTLLLSQCAYYPEQYGPITEHCHLKPLPKSWTARGIIAVNDGQTKYTGRIIWKQNDNKLKVIMIGPLGLPYGTMIQTDSGFNWLQGTNQVVDVKMNPLVYHATGWKLPFDEAYYWLLYEFHLKDRFETSQATISVTKKVCVNQTILPKNIDIKHDEFEASIIITHWTI
ncbi:MAG: hypothetical protein CMF42_03580 [Legionellales bacterium]|nr:hypothetical protein [Legionellales bacterium]|tara:strand:- start:876 stop:1412 length:537 start_codon:yes stop_codon:yes gene_type:complete